MAVTDAYGSKHNTELANLLLMCLKWCQFPCKIRLVLSLVPFLPKYGKLGKCCSEWMTVNVFADDIGVKLYTYCNSNANDWFYPQSLDDRHINSITYTLSGI